MKAKLARAVILQWESDQEASWRRSSFVEMAGRAEEDEVAVADVNEVAGVVGTVAAEEDEVVEVVEDVEMRETNFQVESGVAV